MSRSVLVTGGNRGIGLAIARALADAGDKVAVTYRSGEPPAGLLGVRCDVTDRSQCEAAVAEVLARHGRVDVLVNNAGITSPQGLMEVSEESFDRILAVNLRGTVHFTRAVIPSMRQRRSGSIVNLSSVSAQRGGGVFGGAHYAAAKAAVLGFTKGSARELAPDNIRVNAICPSMIDTDITGGMLTPERRQAIIASIPMGRIGDAVEVAGCCLFLASDLSSYVTGTEVDVNGGSHIH